MEERFFLKTQRTSLYNSNQKNYTYHLEDPIIITFHSYFLVVVAALYAKKKISISP